MVSVLHSTNQLLSRTASAMLSCLFRKPSPRFKRQVTTHSTAAVTTKARSSRLDVHELPQVVAVNQERSPRRDRSRSFRNSMLFRFGCTCNECRPDLYSNETPSCRLEHQRAHLSIDEDGEPMVTGTPHNKFEALHLADTAIEAFRLGPTRMRDVQFAALQTFRLYRNDLVKQLSQKDCSSLAPRMMTTVIKHLDQILFLGVRSPRITFSWDANYVEDATSTHLGYCSTRLAHTGQYYHDIFLNPTMVLPGLEGSRAAARIGTLLHEMLHGFLFALGCGECRTATENMGVPIEGHGRAWHRVAKAIEMAAPGLLGIPGIDLGRFETLVLWHEDPRARCQSRLKAQCNPSCHDMQSYGFV